MFQKLRKWIDRVFRRKFSKEISRLTGVNAIVGKKLEILPFGNMKALSITITEPSEIDIIYPLDNPDNARNIIESIANAFGLSYVEIGELDMRFF